MSDPYNTAQPETRPDLESDPPDAPNQPGIDPYANSTLEGSEGMATDVLWSSPYNIATPETRPELESDPPDSPNQPSVDPYANKG